jgi:hypothetical protein
MEEKNEVDQPWIQTITEHYTREPSSPFELNVMEAKIRRQIQAPKKHVRTFLPAFASLLTLVLVTAWVFTQNPDAEMPAHEMAQVQINEPSIQLFSVNDLESDDENYLPDDYITISQVMFD